MLGGRRFSPLLVLLSVLLSGRLTICYVDLPPTFHDTIPDYIPRVPIPRPWQLPPDFELVTRDENFDTVATAADDDDDNRHHPDPSLITAISPTTTTMLASNGSIVETQWSVHYAAHVARTRQGKGVFDRRGVFASDPPIATCTPCGYQGSVASTNGTGGAVTQTTASCTLHTYLGVFRSHVGPVPAASSSYCYDSSYTGVFQASSSTSTGLPCCFTIPASCRSNASVSTSYTYTTGVFRSTTFWSNFTTTTTTSATASLSSSRTLGTVSMTSLRSSSSNNQISSSSSAARTVSVGLSTLAPDQDTSTFSSSSTTRSSTARALSEITSVTVISSSTVTVVVNLSLSSSTISSKLSSVVVAPVTLSVVTTFPSFHSAYVTTIITTVNNTIYGCGTASGSGEIIGTGTVYVGGVAIVSSGTVSGSATRVVGCGTVIATTGSFSGSATIIGCGTGSGFATLDGSGTVYPAALGGLVGITSSGRVTGSGLVIGCGTIIGSGTFTANVPYTTTRFETVAPNQGTVEVYVSYCPSNENGLPRIAGNRTSPAAVSYFPVGGNSIPTIALEESLDNPLCHVCENDAGICCPLGSICGSNGHCPWQALERSGYVLEGLNVVAMKNSSDSN